MWRKWISSQPFQEQLGPYFRRWDKLADSLPALLEEGKVRDDVQKVSSFQLHQISSGFSFWHWRKGVQFSFNIACDAKRGTWKSIVPSCSRYSTCEVLNIVSLRYLQLPLLDYSKLETKEEYVRAHLVLSLISHAYVWCKGEEGVVKVCSTSII